MSPLGRRGPQVRAPWHHGDHGAVDVVGPVAPPGHACSCGSAGVYTDWLKRPLRAGLGHLCTLLGCGAVADRRGEVRSVHRLTKMASRCHFGAFVYTVATRVAMRIATRAAPGGTSASATTACRRRPLAGPSRLVGKTGSARVAPLSGWHLRRDVNPHEPLKSLINYDKLLKSFTIYEGKHKLLCGRRRSHEARNLQ